MFELSKKRSRWGSDSKVVISHEVVGPDASSVLCMRLTSLRVFSVGFAVRWIGAYTTKVSGYPGPTNDILMLVPLSAPKYWSIRPPVAPFTRGWRFRPPSSSPSWSDGSSARCHLLYLELALEETGPAVPKMFRHSMSVLSGTSKVSLLASASSESSEVGEAGGSGRVGLYMYSSKMSEKTKAVAGKSRFSTSHGR